MHIRRIFSISGVIPLFFVILHLFLYFTSSFWINNQTHFFLWIMNFNKLIFNKLYLEILLIYFPLTIHILIGLNYMTRKSYYFKIHTPYTLRKANSLQRVSAWILLILLIFHVLQMRIIKHPQKLEIENTVYYVVKVKSNDKIYKIADKLNIKILEGSTFQSKTTNLESSYTFAAAPNMGLAFLMMIIDNFQNKFMVILYSIFVLIVSFHGFNGLWMFLIYFSILKTQKMKKYGLYSCFSLMFIFSIFGLTPVWINFIK